MVIHVHGREWKLREAILEQIFIKIWSQTSKLASKPNIYTLQQPSYGAITNSKHAHTTYSGMSPSRAMILCSTDQPENLVNHSSRKAGRGWGGSISSSSLNVLPPFSIYKELVLPYGFQKLDRHNKTSNIKLLSLPIATSPSCEEVGPPFPLLRSPTPLKSVPQGLKPCSLCFPQVSTIKFLSALTNPFL